MLRRRFNGIAGAALLRIVFNQYVGRSIIPVGKLPISLVSSYVVLHVFHVPAPLQYQRFQPLLGKLLRGPAATNSRADDDGIVGVLVFCFSVNIHRFFSSIFSNDVFNIVLY